MQQAKFILSHLGKVLGKQTKEIEGQGKKPNKNSLRSRNTTDQFLCTC